MSGFVNTDIFALARTRPPLHFSSNSGSFSSSMISIHRQEVPLFLQQGSFFAALDAEDTDCFQVPADCFKKCAEIHSPSDLMSHVRTLRYWGVDDLPMDTILYLISRNCDLGLLSAEFPEYACWWEKIGLINARRPSEGILPMAIKAGLPLGIIEDLHKSGKFPLTWQACAMAASVDAVDILAYLHTQGC